MLQSRPRVFLASTLRPEEEALRESAIQAIVDAGCTIIAAENFGADGRQRPLEGCLSRVKEADVVVVYVAHLYGTEPVGKEQSFTWLECEAAVESKIEVLAYLISEETEWPIESREEHSVVQAVRLEELSDESILQRIRVARRRFVKLQNFKTWLREQGLSGQFTSCADLRLGISRDLICWQGRRGDPAFNRGQVVMTYMEWVRRTCENVRSVTLPTIRAEPAKRVSFTDIYIPLLTSSMEQGELAGTRLESVLSRLESGSLYLHGKPGSGKSTFCRWVAWLLANPKLRSTVSEEEEEFHEAFPESLKGYLPVLIRLNEFALYLREGKSELTRKQFLDSIRQWLQKRSPGGLDWSTFEWYLAQGKLILMFDGADELPRSMRKDEESISPRGMFISGLVDTISVWIEQGNRILITSRSFEIAEVALRELRLSKIIIADLPQKLVRKLAAHWFRILSNGERESGEQTAARMLREIGEQSNLGIMIRNPMLLTAMCLIYSQHKMLPRDVCDLYDKIVTSVLYNRLADNEDDIGVFRRQLGMVAREMHTGEVAGMMLISPQLEIPSAGIDEVLKGDLPQAASRARSGVIKKVAGARLRLNSESGLLVPGISGASSSFLHPSIQEFLAAEQFAMSIDSAGLVELFCKRAKVEDWHNTLAFVYGIVQRTKKNTSVKLLEKLLGVVDIVESGLLAVVCESLLLSFKNQVPLTESVKRLFMSVFDRAIGQEVHIRDRLRLHLVLGEFGDGRIAHDLRKPEGYETIGPGTFSYNGKMIFLRSPIFLSKFPVTNSQFKYFLDDKGYENKELWSEGGWQWARGNNVELPYYWSDIMYSNPSQPVVGVSYYEAEAFCKWAGGFIPTDNVWEIAAGCARGSVYPWGSEWRDGICNSFEAQLEVTTPVGMFLGSKCEEFNVYDMAGNVWEWVDDGLPDSKTKRLRGGAYFCDKRCAESKYQKLIQKTDRQDIIGFRVAKRV